MSSRLTRAVLSVLSICVLGTTCADAGPQAVNVEEFSITASDSSISIGEAALLLARAVSEDGQEVAVPVEWSASGGSVTPASPSTGLFTASSPGTYAIVARGAAAPFAESSITIGVAEVTSPVTGLVLSPETATLNTSGVQQFLVVGERLDGSQFLPAAQLTATGGSITPTGLYTAATTAGEFRVIATLDGGAFADTSTITIQGTSGELAEPVPTGNIFFDGRAGGAQSFQSATTLADIQGFLAANGGVGFDDGNWSFVTDYNGAGKNALRLDWNANPSGESSNTATYYYPASYARVYASLVIHLGRTATGGGNGSIGSFVPVTGAGGMKRFMWLRAKDNGTDRLYWVWPTGGQPSGNLMSIDNLDLDVPFSANYGVGQDVRWTFELISGNPSTVRVWRNGALVLNNTNAGIGNLPFAESQLSTVRFATQQAESEYWTDLVLWTTP